MRKRRRAAPVADLKERAFVAPPVQRGSSVLFGDLDSFERAAANRFEIAYYGRYGTPTTFQLEKLVAELECADKTYAVSSGHAAITVALLAFLSPGDHILLPAGAYEPTKHLSAGLLRQYGIAADFYPTRAGKEIATYLRATTRLIWIEAPGSLTYEIGEIDEIVACAKSQGIVTIADNTWASCCLFKPLQLGVDISVVSATKYMSGHSDVIGGFISTRSRHRKVIEAVLIALGPALSPDAAYLIWRGLQTMEMRIRRQSEAALAIATALSSDNRVGQVYYPGLPASPDYLRWRKYFTGANGLLSFTLPGASRSAASTFIAALKCFRLGVSWGGFESLVFLRALTGSVEEPTGWLVRLSIGLQDPEDVLSDLDQALSAQAAAIR